MNCLIDQEVFEKRQGELNALKKVETTNKGSPLFVEYDLLLKSRIKNLHGDFVFVSSL